MRNAPKNKKVTNAAQAAQLLTVGDVAEILQISVRGVWRQVSIGQFPKPIYVGRLARWQVGIVNEWIGSLSPLPQFDQEN